MDNYYKNCPPMMSDGRLFTDYNSSTILNEQIKNTNGINRDDRYRLFLQQNAGKIMDNIWSAYSKMDNCWQNNCHHNYPTRYTLGNLMEEMRDYNTTNVALTHNATGNNCRVYQDMRMS